MGDRGDGHQGSIEQGERGEGYDCQGECEDGAILEGYSESV
jgi:hypothetical protein